jgi:plasmid stabilization system protein ParE
VAEIVWTQEATRWLQDIHEYIASESPSAAHKVVTGIYQKIQLLREHPRLGQRYEPIADREVREILYGHYRIAYLVNSAERIEILAIFHGALDIESYLP